MSRCGQLRRSPADEVLNRRGSRTIGGAWPWHVECVQRAQRGLRRGLLGFLASTALLGVVFLGLKAYEYWSHYTEGLVPGALWTYAGQHSGPPVILLPLFRHDRSPCGPPHGGRGSRDRADRSGPAPPVHGGVPHAGRGDRALLASDRRDLGLPLSAFLSDRMTSCQTA